ncbi:UNVERIFIED_CONTAM: hypothetical protein Sradi_4514300 [Sesamum radiatum]|uniref:Uncharacterized protein n=1 Tax=Sesamum radiatum TaxID=300843 RepID=A0AAW2N875_SESRA
MGQRGLRSRGGRNGWYDRRDRGGFVNGGRRKIGGNEGRRRWGSRGDGDGGAWGGRRASGEYGGVAGIDQVLDLVDVRLGARMQRDGVAIRHFACFRRCIRVCFS